MQIVTESQKHSKPTSFYLTNDELEEESFSNIHKWTKAEYHRMAELGFFDNVRVELIDGEIIVNTDYEITKKDGEIFMVMNSPHAVAIRLALQVLRSIFSQNYLIDSQLPLNFGENSEPEPDVAVIEGNPRDFIESHPNNPLLVVEVSDSTLRYDRKNKAEFYARNNVSDYWIINLKHRKLEVYRRPENGVYMEIRIFTQTDEVSPLAAPEAKIKVADLLP